MQVVLYPAFERVVKKLHANAKKDLDKAVKTLIQNPHAGDLKKGDLNGIRVFKFKMVQQLTLLAYRHNEVEKKLVLLALSSHENFYRDLKK
jgi:mRNA-degrading endonuclease YafQ of YafQ-DinJ toxin-antitoxin module